MFGVGRPIRPTAGCRTAVLPVFRSHTHKHFLCRHYNSVHRHHSIPGNSMLFSIHPTAARQHMRILHAMPLSVYVCVCVYRCLYVEPYNSFKGVCVCVCGAWRTCQSVYTLYSIERIYARTFAHSLHSCKNKNNICSSSEKNEWNRSERVMAVAIGGWKTGVDKSEGKRCTKEAKRGNAIQKEKCF